MRNIGFFLVSFFVSIVVFSQEIVTDRPDQTESAQTVGLANLQIEAGMVNENISSNISNFYAPSVLFRYGLSKSLELRIVVQKQFSEIDANEKSNYLSGLNDLEFGAKLQLYKPNKSNTEIAFLSHIVIPTAKEIISTNSIGVVNKLAISHDISNTIGIGYNIGYDFIEKEHSLTYSIALGIALSNGIGFYVEPYGTMSENGFFENNYDFGCTYLINKNLQLDASYGRGFNNNMEYISAGLSWKIQKIFKKSKT